MNHTAVLPEQPPPRQDEPGLDSVGTVRCPLPLRQQRLDAVTLDPCHRLEKAGCPLASPVQERFETLLAELSATFVNLPAGQVDSQIESALQRLVVFLGIDRGGLAELLADQKQLVITHSYHRPGVPPHTRLILDEQLPWYTGAIYHGEILRFPELPDDLPPEAVRERAYCLQVGLKSHVMIPLRVMDAVVGAIGFGSFHGRHDWPDDLIQRLRLVGEIFTNALARKRADEALRAREESLRQTRERLRNLAARLIHAQEEERRRLAREMHDDWTQRLVLLGIDVAKVEKHIGEPEKALPLLRAMQEHLIGLSRDVHALSRQLHPSILDDLGLVEALRCECAGFSRREGIAVVYRPEGVPSNLPKDVSLCVYRIAQEALRNLAKHAAVNEAWVRLAATGQELVLAVEDKGIGFVRQESRSSPGLGLSSMEERVRLIQGRLSVISAPGRGTTVEVRVPLEGVTHEQAARVLLADDHQILAEALRGLLEPEFDVVGVVADGRELVAAARKKSPDVIVADVTMPSLNGIDAAVQLRDAGVKSKVVFLTMHRDVEYARRAMEAGASGYVLKHGGAAELVTAIREALRGGTYVTPMLASELLQSYRDVNSRPHGPAHGLTERQREVLQLVAEGRSAKEVAAVLKISSRTAEAHKARILEVLRLNTTAELVQYAIRNGIISV